MPCRVPTTGKPGVRRSGSARSAATTWERHDGAASAPLHYRRREPEKTLLHAVVREHLESFFAHARERSSHGRGLPAFVERDLRAYTSCGILARGFARVRCPDCGFERLVAFSCKASICPSCATRRMEDGADHLVRNVFPAVPLRQWVLLPPPGALSRSTPSRSRLALARHLHEGRLRLAAQGRPQARGGRSADWRRHRGPASRKRSQPQQRTFPHVGAGRGLHAWRGRSRSLCAPAASGG